MQRLHSVQVDSAAIVSKPLDFAVSDFDSGVYVFLGNGNGSFQAPALIQTGNSPSALLVHDFNGDGKLDLAVAGSH